MRKSLGKTLFGGLAIVAAAALTFVQPGAAQAPSNGPPPNGPPRGPIRMEPDPRVQQRTYHFDDTNEDLAYTVFVSSKVRPDKPAPLIVALHASWLIALWWLAPGRSVDAFWLAMFVLLELARIWVLASLGPRWTTRIIILPQAPLVRRGPYRWINHPNYWVVIGEIAVLPLVFGLWLVALVFSLLNAALLTIRIREENRALGR